MKAEFSEFSYGFAVVHECLENAEKNSIKAAPLFPSLIKEGREFGFDTKIEFSEPIFLQFKLSQYLTIRGKEGKYLKKPYYRFKIRNIKQYELLKKWSKEHKNVFYTAPLFYANFDRVFLEKKVINKSVFINLRNLRKPENASSMVISYMNKSGFFITTPKTLKPVYHKASLDAPFPCRKKGRIPHFQRNSINEIIKKMFTEVRNIIELEGFADLERSGELLAKIDEPKIELQIESLHSLFRGILDLEPLIVYKSRRP